MPANACRFRTIYLEEITDLLYVLVGMFMHALVPVLVRKAKSEGFAFILKIRVGFNAWPSDSACGREMSHVIPNYRLYINYGYLLVMTDDKY